MPNACSRLILAGVAIALAGCGSCWKKDDGKTEKVAVGLPNEELPRDLKPLPEPPQMSIAPEALAGAGGELAVVAARPQGPMRGEVRPTITFSKPVKSLEMIEAQRQSDKEQPFAKVEPSLEGEWRWLGSASAEFVPKGLVPYSTEYKVTVFKGLRAIDGAEMKADHSFAFSTPKLALQDVTPQRGHQWLTPDQTVKLLFNQPVKESELQAALSFEVEGTAPLKAKVLSRTSIAEERRKAEEEAKKQGRHYERMSFEERGIKNQQHRYEIAAVQPLPLDKRVTLRIAGSLHGEQGPITMGSDEAIGWKVYGAFAFARAGMCLGSHRCPYGPLVLYTTNPVDIESIKGKVTITPPVELDWERAGAYESHEYYDDQDHGPYVAIPGKFKPGTRYQVSVAPGVSDRFKQRTDKPFSSEADTKDLAPALHTGGFFGLIEAASGTKLPIEVVNLKALEVQLWALTLPDLARLMTDSRWQPRAPDSSERQSLKYAWNQPRVHPIDLGPVLGGKKTGAVLALLNSPDLEYRSDGYRTITQVTDLAVHVKLGPKSSLAWVTRLSSGAPVEGASVTVFDQTGADRWRGTTDKNGFADVPGAVALNLPGGRYEWERPFAMVAAEKDGDQSATSAEWDSGVEPYEFGLSAGWEGTTPQTSGFVFSERGIYRPGDKVYLKGVVRFRQVGELKAPKQGSLLTVKVTDSRGEQVKAENVSVTRFGTFAAEVQIKPEAPTGYYQVEARGSAPESIELSGAFRVEEYRAPQFKVDVEPAKPNLVAGEALEGKVFARYLFGGPMSNAKTKWSVHRESTSFAPEAGNGFTFSQETWWWDDNAPRPASGFFSSGEGVADARGALEVKAGEVEAPAERTYAYTLEAEVEDVNRQVVAGRAEVTVHPAAFYVGLRAPGGFMQAEKEYGFDTLVLDPAGARAKGRKVEVTISSRTWKSVKRKDASGGFTTVSEPVEEKVSSCQLESAEQPVPCKFKPAQSGFFIVKAAVADDRGRKHSSSLGVYATGPGFVAWQRNDTERIDLLPDKTLYDVGEVAKVLIKSPYPEARAMLTVEREGVFERRPLSLKGSVATVEIPITEEMVPNVYASVLLVRPRVAEGGIETGDDPGRPAARLGLLKLNVEKKVKRLAVKLSTGREEYRPGEEVAVEVELKDHSGKPAAAEVTLYAVDEAVLRLTNYQTPDPIAAIFPERPLSVQFGEPLLHLVRRRSYGEKGEEQGGGGGQGEGKGFRSNFKTTVYFNPTLEVGADGKGRAKFKLPDNLTTFRIMAVAITERERFGAAETFIKVNKPLLALPALPRFARVGDQFEAGVVVHSYGAGKGEVTISASAENALIEGPAEKKADVAEGAPREVRFGFLAERAGVATFRFKVRRGADEDGVELKIPVELPVGFEAVATYGDTQDERVEGVVPPSAVWPGMGGLEVTMASTSLGNFQQGFQQLIEYPYGCLEQQTSRLVPFVALREISGKFGVPWPGPERKKQQREAELAASLRTYLFGSLDVSEERDPDRVIASTVDSILELQNPDGSFRYWTSSWCSSSWASAYATLALHRARQVGFSVPPERLARAEGYLTKVMGGQCNPCESWCPDETRVFAGYVLSRLGRPKPSYHDEFLKKRNTLSLFSQALLADQMFVGGGDRGQAKALLQEILNHAKESPKGVHLEEVHGQTYATLWHSDTRTTGVVLQTLTDISPDHPYVSKLARYLTSVRQGDGRWRSTQEAAFSLMALTEVLRTKERDEPDFRATLAMDSSKLMEEAFKGRSMAVRSKALGIDELIRLGSGKGQKLTFRKEGPGVLYYSALLKYAPKELPMKPLDAGLYVQRWFEPYSGGGQTTRFYAGDLVRVRMRVGTNQERHWTAFEVPLPAGLEPVDTTLASTARLTRSPAEESRETEYEYESDEDQVAGSAYEEEEGRGGVWAFQFWSPFNHVEQRDSRVVLFADHLPPGIHVSSFVARATTPGTFLLKPARGELMYEPEVFGRSEGGTFEVVLPAEVSQR
ncbi:MAG: alpha-2-macroglobulin [Myxococcales bacterium]|nr:alpha-2-macroglobulin [Myxococcales bacterium]